MSKPLLNVVSGPAPQVEEPIVAFESEQAVLGGMLISKTATAHVLSILNPDDFGCSQHRIIFRAVAFLAEKGTAIDVLTIPEHLKKQGCLDDVGGFAYISTLAESVPTAAHVEYYVDEVLRASVLRRLTRAGHLISRMSEEYDDRDALERAEHLIRSIQERRAKSGHTGGYVLGDREGEIVPPPRWIVENVLTEGLTIIAGKPKQGKSWFTLQVSLAVALGGVAFGKIPVDPGKVLYLALEDTEGRMLNRVTAIMRGEQWPSRMIVFHQWPRMDNGGLQQLASWFIKHPDTRLVVIDTFAKIRSVPDGRGNAYDEDYRAIGDLKAIADAHGASIVIVHHQRKMGSEDWLESLSGTMGLSGAADSIIGFFRERGRDNATIKITGRDVEEAEYAIEWTTPAWFLMGPAEEYGKTQAQEDVLAVLREAGGPLRYRALVEAIALRAGINEAGAKQRVKRLADLGTIAKDGQMYWLPQDVQFHNGSFTPNVCVSGVTTSPETTPDSYSSEHSEEINASDSSDSSGDGHLKAMKTSVLWAAQDAGTKHGYPRLTLSSGDEVEEGARNWKRFLQLASVDTLNEIILLLP